MPPILPAVSSPVKIATEFLFLQYPGVIAEIIFKTPVGIIATGGNYSVKPI